MEENGTLDEKSEKGKDKDSPIHKFRGIPEDVQLFEVFWKQVVELIKVSQLLVPAFIGDTHRQPYARLGLTYQYKTSRLSLYR